MSTASGQTPAYALARVLAMAMVAIAALFFINLWLAQVERSELRVEARRYYENGQRFMASGQSAQAVEQFRSALATERGNADYALALGEAQLASDRLAEAEATLKALLQDDPASGPGNLALARVLVRQGKIVDATFYYHRAIYGHWNQDTAANQIKTRFELAELLSRGGGAKEALLAELLPLQGEAPDDVATKKKLGRLFLAAGSPARAAAVYRDILKSDSQDAEAHAGLAEAEFDSANYRGAWQEFSTALRLNPDDENARKRFDLSMDILALDPTLPGIGSEERYRRSQKLVESAANDLRQCMDAAAPKQLLDAAEAALKKPRRSDLTEENLELAAQLWDARETNCKQRLAPDEEAMARVFADLGPRIK